MLPSASVSRPSVTRTTLVFHRVLSHRPPNEEVTLPALNGDPLSQRSMYLRCNFEIPFTTPSGFELIIPGRKSRFVTSDSLDSHRVFEIDLVLECAGNGRTLMDPVPGGARWRLGGVSPITVRGVKLADVLGSLPDAVGEVVFTGADRGVVEPEGEINYQFSLAREDALSRVPMIVTHIGGEPLTPQHGAPLRLVVPGQYAMKSVKWLTRVEAITYPFLGHFVRKYRYFGDDMATEGSRVGEIAVRSIISRPSDGEGVPAGPVEIGGSAWSGAGEITGVEVSVNGGRRWVTADLIQRETGGMWAPIQWSAAVNVRPGEKVAMARATDSTGATQPLKPRWNKLGYANNVVHSVSFEALELTTDEG